MGKKTKSKSSSETSEKNIVYKRYLAEDSDDDFSDDEIGSKSNKSNLKKITNTQSISIIEKEDEDDYKKEDSTEEIILPAETVLSEIRNKVRRLTVYNKMKKEKKKAKRDLKKLRAKEEELTGKKRVKCIPHTIESKRETDNTIANDSDEDVAVEESRDVYASYYTKKYEPKVLITASNIIHGRTMKFLKELALIIPNSQAKWRNRCGLEKVIRDAPSKGFTDIIIINEDRRVPTGMLIIHLPDGPAALFRLNNVRVCKDLGRNIKDFTGHRPEIILNNFKTRLGRVIARMFGALFHFEPEFKGRSVCTFHNQRDYIFFRYHRYEFKNKEKVSLKELGPRFTMRLEWLRKGAFGGDFEWTLKRHEMETSRRMFFL